jgi:nucleotide-binding universal stress UspA family protein
MTNSAPSPSSATGSIDTPIEVERIVVGVDGSQGSQMALQWALLEAQLRGVTVHAVFAWQFHPNWSNPGPGSTHPVSYSPGGGTGSGLPSALSPDIALSTGIRAAGEPAQGGRIDAEAAVNNTLDAAIADATVAEPADSKLMITHEAIEGHAAKVLLDTVTDSDLLVVGSRGHGEFAGALLGSISQHVVSHAPCPVVVVPDPRRAARQDRDVG